MSDEEKSRRLEIGLRVRRQRLALNLSQVELGKLIGVTGIMVGAVERGETKLPPRRAGFWANALKLQVETLMSPEDWEDEDIQGAALPTLEPDQRRGVLALMRSMQRKPS